MNHTPGKWLIHPHVDVEYSIFNETGTIHIADVTIEADAKLITAAPNLLEALTELVTCGSPKNFDNARAAIKKATE